MTSTLHPRFWGLIRFALCLTCGLALGAAAPGSAAPGDLDTTFGIGGRGFAAVAGADTVRGETIALAPGGKYVVAGRCGVFATNTTHFCVIRSLGNGFFDTSFFGTGNKRIFAANGDTEIPRAVAVQVDGKVVIAGQCGPEGTPTHMCVVRLLEDGSADDSFGTSGKVKFNFGGSGVQVARDMAILPDGRIMLAGQCSGSAIGAAGGCVVRLNANGSVDTSFGTSGRTYIINTVDPDTITSMIVTPDSKIVIASYGNSSLAPGNTLRTYVSQLLPNGVIDASFGVGGTTELPLATSLHSRLPRLARQPDGKIVVAVVCNNGAEIQCGYRLDASGQFESGFAYPTGALGLAINSADYGMKPLLQSDGKIVWTSSRVALPPPTGTGTLDFQNLRSTDLGVLDQTYVGGGTKAMYAADDRANDAVIQSDDKIVIAGTCWNGSTYHMCLARVEAGPFSGRNCSMDIDGDGRVLPTTDAVILARASLGLSGAAVLGGINTTGTRNNWALIRDYLINQCGMSHLAP